MPMNRTSGAVLAGAAVGFLAGLAASPARKIAMQSADMAAGDWVAALTAEHRMVQKALEALCSTRERESAKRQGLLLKIAYALNKHAIEEENVVYPAIRKLNKDAAADLVAEHAEIKALLSELQYGLDKGDARWLATAEMLKDKVLAHARQEEEQVFPQIKAQMSDEENAAITRHMNWEGLKIA